jgi:hypothetical protein
MALLAARASSFEIVRQKLAGFLVSAALLIAMTFPLAILWWQISTRNLAALWSDRGRIAQFAVHKISGRISRRCSTFAYLSDETWFGQSGPPDGARLRARDVRRQSKRGSDT